MKKLFTLLLALVATTALWAQRFQVGDLYYDITRSWAPYTVEVTYQKYNSDYNYSRLTTATIPETVNYNGTTYNVTSIGYKAFYGCSSLTSVTIPNSVTSIKSEAFKGCSSLTSVTIPNSVRSIGGGTFYKCTSLTSVTIPNSITSIEGSAFFYCSSLTSVTIPNSVTNIGGGAFYKCYGLTSITIPNSVTSIGEEAFVGCSGLTSVIIGNSVTSVGNYAFWGCESLKEVICYAEKVPQMGKEVFYYTPQSEATLYVLADALEDYKAAEQWKEFGTILPIQEPSTDLENTHSPSPMANRQKLLRDGQLIILRDGKSYSVMGQEL